MNYICVRTEGQSFNVEKIEADSHRHKHNSAHVPRVIKQDNIIDDYNYNYKTT